MPETNWLLNDSAPVTMAQEFTVAPSEASWGWFGLPMAGEGSEFSAPAAPWAEHDWLAVLGYRMATVTGGGTYSKSIIFSQAIRRAACY